MPARVAADKRAAIPTPVINLPAGKTDVQFFPEGGDLVAGITTTVAFKAVTPNGLGVDIKGTVTGSNGQQVTQFTSSHLGMGQFELTPVEGVAYQANIIDADGKTSTYPLPAVITKGYVLNITDNTQNLHVRVSASKSLLTGNSNAQLTLVAQSGGKIYYTEKINPQSAIFTLTILKSIFPTGIVQFTLFSPAGEPLKERLVFIQNADKLHLVVTTDKQTYAPRQKVSMSLSAQNRDNQPLTGNFSVSVTDETKMPVNEDDENNIMANLLLTSDLRGYVEQPAYYFKKNDDKARVDLDILMLTQGYHRFEWQKILNSPVSANQFQPENSLQVAGTVLTVGGKPVANARVKLYNLDSIQFTRDTVTDLNGRFVFNNLTFNDSVRFIIQARTSKNKKNVDIKMDNVLPVNTSTNRHMPSYDINITNDLSVYAQSSKLLYAEQRKFGLGNHVISLQEVVIREKKQALKHSANLNGPGNADQIIMGRSFRDLGCIRIADCLEGRLVGVIFRNGVAYSTRDFYKPMQLIVDGVYVDPGYLNVLNYIEVQSIEVLRNAGSTAIYGGRGGSGVLVITTRNGDDNDDYPAPIYGRGITTYYPKGYYKARTFYSPRYDDPKTNKQLADLRTTIFWKPNLITGKDGKTTFGFFNAGTPGMYRVVIEGIGGDGNIGRYVYRYKVQ